MHLEFDVWVGNNLPWLIGYGSPNPTHNEIFMMYNCFLTTTFDTFHIALVSQNWSQLTQNKTTNQTHLWSDTRYYLHCWELDWTKLTFKPGQANQVAATPLNKQNILQGDYM